MGQSTKLKRLRKLQCSAMRCKRWCGDKAQATTYAVQVQQKERPPKGPMLQSSFPYKKVANVDLPYVVNMQMLVEALHNRGYPVRRCVPSFKDKMQSLQPNKYGPSGGEPLIREKRPPWVF